MKCVVPVGVPQGSTRVIAQKIQRTLRPRYYRGPRDPSRQGSYSLVLRPENRVQKPCLALGGSGDIVSTQRLQCSSFWVLDLFSS